MATPKRKTDVKLNSYDVNFKLKVIEEASQLSNREAARKFGVDEKSIREWKKQVTHLKSFQEQYGGTNRKRLHGAGRKPLSLGNLEKELADWISAQKDKGSRISYKMIAAKGLELHPNNTFKASRRWIQNFLKRRNLKIQCKKANDSTNDITLKASYFINKLRNSIKEKSIPPEMIANMDETEIWFDVPVEGSGHEKQMITVVLGAMADGRKLPPLVILKGQPGKVTTVAKDPGVKVAMSSNGWMTEETVKVWLRKCWTCCSRDERILVWDEFHCHHVHEVQEQLKTMATKVCVVPSECGKYLNPAEMSWNEAFQANFWNLHDKWKAKGKDGQRPLDENLVSWVKFAWENVSRETIAKSFRDCGIALATDGSEDDRLVLGGDKKLTGEVKQWLKNLDVTYPLGDHSADDEGEENVLMVVDDFNTDDEM